MSVKEQYNDEVKKIVDRMVNLMVEIKSLQGDLKAVESEASELTALDVKSLAAMKYDEEYNDGKNNSKLMYKSDLLGLIVG